MSVKIRSRSTAESRLRQRRLGAQVLLAVVAICAGLLELGDKTRDLKPGHHCTLHPWALSVLLVVLVAGGVGAFLVLRSFRNEDPC